MIEPPTVAVVAIRRSPTVRREAGDGLAQAVGHDPRRARVGAETMTASSSPPSRPTTSPGPQRALHRRARRRSGAGRPRGGRRVSLTALKKSRSTTEDRPEAGPPAAASAASPWSRAARRVTRTSVSSNARRFSRPVSGSWEARWRTTSSRRRRSVTSASTTTSEETSPCSPAHRRGGQRHVDASRRPCASRGPRARRPSRGAGDGAGPAAHLRLGEAEHLDRRRGSSVSTRPSGSSRTMPTGAAPMTASTRAGWRRPAPARRRRRSVDVAQT